jgi:hypothetical protein
MRLERISTNFMHAHEAESSKFSPHTIFDLDVNNNRIYADFPHFGAGSEKFSDFVVSLSWDDVEAVIQTFAEMGNTAAVQLNQARKLASAVKEFVKNSN